MITEKQTSEIKAAMALRTHPPLGPRHGREADLPQTGGVPGRLASPTRTTPAGAALPAALALGLSRASPPAPARAPNKPPAPPLRSASGTSLNFFITSCDSLWLEHRAQGHIREQRYLAWIGTTTCPLQPLFPCFRRVRAPSCCRALFLACQGQGSLQVPSIARSTEPSNVLLIDAALSRRRQVAGCPRVSAGMRTTQPGQMRPAHVLQAVREAEFRSAEVAIAPSLFLLLLYQCRKSASITDLSHRPGDTLWHRQLPAVLSANASTLAGVGRRHWVRACCWHLALLRFRRPSLEPVKMQNMQMTYGVNKVMTPAWAH